MDRRTAQMISPMLDDVEDTPELKDFYAVIMDKLGKLTDDSKVIGNIIECVQDCCAESQLIGLQAGIINGVRLASRGDR